MGHACVPEDRHHANCQWKYTDSDGKDFYLDLSSQKGELIRGPLTSNGYEQFYSPCQNAFHYYLSEKCMNGQPGEETIRWYCDSRGKNATLINATYDGDCRHEMNIKSPLACPGRGEYNEWNGVAKEKLF